MTAAVKWNLISEAEYLRGELLLEVKHEYMGGVLYAMAGAGNAHNRMATNVTVTLRGGCLVVPVRSSIPIPRFG